MRIMPLDVKDNTIEKYLLTNASSPRDYNEAKHLFQTLKEIRTQNNIVFEKSIIQPKRTFKNFALSLLQASALSPPHHLTGYLSGQKDSALNFSLPVGTGRFSIAADSELAYRDTRGSALPYNRTYASAHDYPATGTYKARRVARSIDNQVPLYLPPADSAIDGINLLLQDIYHEVEGLFGHPDPLITSLGYYLDCLNYCHESAPRYLLRFSGLFGAKKKKF
ncbi:hypothetical protein ABK905_05085 [Acerihabitans sp. KWT182]|uniref:Uncharacterized protein n=1 Tax=Acerihabitans sp. KWT182 TaxID=3157919 RepID=A0AAU7QE00_9GAMM